MIYIRIFLISASFLTSFTSNREKSPIKQTPNVKGASQTSDPDAKRKDGRSKRPENKRKRPQPVFPGPGAETEKRRCHFPGVSRSAKKNFALATENCVLVKIRKRVLKQKNEPILARLILI
ncbi:hypothetical protein GWI33_011586 [Rhynchophorus ferrugineus]|uniref:Secreted protein n=1 Tax=Rhynchophorus ferrugineus TaxID=354439 RepID=A0A834IAQ4_RHYFE|nr:hypothetical protein GWI33_011586 [Rhynchophorus ferrugineus]